MNAEVPAMPRDFGWRYLGWLCWTNKLSVLFTLQCIFLEITADSDLPRNITHHCLAAANIIGLVLAQISRKQGTLPPPTKEAKNP